MQLIFLGTGSKYSTPLSGVSTTVIKHEDGSYWLFNCGEGTQIQLQKSCVKIGKISKIFITDLRGDHLFGLPGLLCILNTTCEESPRSLLEIIGPKGLRQYLRNTLLLSHTILDYSYLVHELDLCTEQLPANWKDWNLYTETCNISHPNEEVGHLIKRDTQADLWKIFEDERLVVQANWLQHKTPSYGYVIHEKPQPGNLDCTKMEAFSLLPGPLCALLKRGESVSNGYGRIISPTEVLGPPRPGRKLVILGSTSNSKAMEKVASNADLLIHEVSFENDLESNVIEEGFSTPKMAGLFAQSIKAQQLILTHLSQKTLPKMQNKAQDCADAVNKLVREAKASFKSGNVIAAEDLMVIRVFLKKPPKN